MTSQAMPNVLAVSFSKQNIMKPLTSIRKTNLLIDSHHQPAEEASGKGLPRRYATLIRRVFSGKTGSDAAFIEQLTAGRYVRRLTNCRADRRRRTL